MPAALILSALCSAAVLERTPGRTGTYLRVTPRFLAHAESSGSRLCLQGRATTPVAALGAALATWDDFHHDPTAAAVLLVELLAERDQLGLLRPVFPMIEQFAQVPA